MKISYILHLLTFLLLGNELSAQVNTKYWVYLTDKAGSPYSVSNPSAYLSVKAMQRRATQGISIKTNDLPVNPSYIAGIQSTGVTVLFSSKWLNAVAIQTTDPNKLNQINSLAYVSSIKPVQRLTSGRKHTQKFEQPISGESLMRTSAAAYNYGPSYRQINMIGGDQLHNLGYKGQGMVIAVLDAGFTNVNVMAAFDSLRNNNRILGTRDFVTGDNDVYSDHSHGTYVLSTMAAILPGQLVGTAPHASYWLLRTEEAATETLIEESNWVRGAEFADSVGADIINSSLGYTVFDDPSQSHVYGDLDGNTTIITRGADVAASKGILVVNSAGNEGSSSWHFISAPADGDSVFTIGAVDSMKVISSFSSRGPSADGRIKPNVCAMGQQAVLAGTGGGIFTGNGTSFSSPIIAGMSACLWQANRNKSNMDVLDAIQRSADRFQNPNNDCGYGIPNYSLANVLLTGIEHIDKNRATYLDVFPNPFNSELNFMLFSKDTQQISLDMFDLSGKLLISRTIHPAANSYTKGTLVLPVSLASGMYFIRMQTSSDVQIKRIVKE